MPRVRPWRWRMLRTSVLGWFVAWVVAWSVSEGILSTAFSREPAGQRPDGGVRWPKAVLWDMDGTLVDTEPYWIEAEYALIEEHGGHLERGARAGAGRQRPDRLRSLPARAHRDRPRAGRDRRGAARRGGGRGSGRRCRGVTGAVELLAALREAGTPCALVTMSYRRFVAPMLAPLPPGTFRGGRHRRRRRPGQATSRALPHRGRGPGPRPAECLAIEDSNTGAPLRGGGRLPRCSWCANHVPVLTGERRVFRRLARRPDPCRPPCPACRERRADRGACF